MVTIYCSLSNSPCPSPTSQAESSRFEEQQWPRKEVNSREEMSQGAKRHPHGVACSPKHCGNTLSVYPTQGFEQIQSKFPSTSYWNRKSIQVLLVNLNGMQKQLMKIKARKAWLPQVKDNTEAWLDQGPRPDGTISANASRVICRPRRLNIHLLQNCNMSYRNQAQPRGIMQSQVEWTLNYFLYHLPPSLSGWKFNEQIMLDYGKIALHFPRIRICGQIYMSGYHRG